MAGELLRAFRAELNQDFRRGVDEMVEVMRANAPRDTGNLARSIVPSVAQLTALIQTTTGEEYPSIIDAGVPGRIYPRNAKALFWEGAAHPVASVAGSTKHQGWWDDVLNKGIQRFDEVVGC